MRMMSLIVLGAFAAVPSFATPVARVNIALATDGREIAATTTLEDGGATLQAPRDGEYGLMMQSPLPVESRLTALVGREVWSVDLPAGAPPRDAVLPFAARAGDVIELCLQSAESAAAVIEAEDFPTLCAPEITQGAGHTDLPPEGLPVSDLDPTLPAPEAATPDPAAAGLDEPQPATPDVR